MEVFVRSPNEKFYSNIYFNFSKHFWKNCNPHGGAATAAVLISKLTPLFYKKEDGENITWMFVSCHNTPRIILVRSCLDTKSDSNSSVFDSSNINKMATR